MERTTQTLAATAEESASAAAELNTQAQAVKGLSTGLGRLVGGGAEARA
jgi:methyl-accepting chemotaxis protein